VPNRGFALRAAIGDGMCDSIFKRIKIADDAVGASYLEMWNIEGPFLVKDQPASGRPRQHVLDSLPVDAPQRLRVTSESPFIDLTRVFPDAGWCLARATCFVFSPIDQEVRMWIGQNDGVAAWVNGKCVHSGRYYAAGLFEDRNLTDTVASYAKLRQGWNEIKLVIESWPAPFNRGWGFSIRFCDAANATVPGLAYAFAVPEGESLAKAANAQVGSNYSWDQVRWDFREQIPELSTADLIAITGVKDLSVRSESTGRSGFVAVLSGARKNSRTYRALNSWQMGKDFDVTLNNVIDLAREACAAFSYEKNGKARTMLFIKPEWAENILTLLQEQAGAQEIFHGTKPMDRVLGFIGSGLRTVIVADVALGDEKDWRVDEEDLMNPIPQSYVPNRGITLHPVSAQ
jgi:hypothetical protein